SSRNNSRNECWLRGRWRRRWLLRCRGSSRSNCCGSLVGLRLQLFLTLALTALGFFTRTLFSSTSCFFRGPQLRLLFLSATQILGLNPLALTALAFQTLSLETCSVLDLTTLGVDFILMVTGLL